MDREIIDAVKNGWESGHLKSVVFVWGFGLVLFCAFMFSIRNLLRAKEVKENKKRN